MIVNRADLADIIGYSYSSIDRFLAQGMPSTSGGGRGVERLYDVTDVVDWLVEREVARAAAERADPAAKAKARESKAKLGLTELKLEERRKSLVHVDDIMRVLGRSDAIVREEIEAVPGRIAAACAAETDPARVERMLKGAFAGALRHVHERISGSSSGQ